MGLYDDAPGPVLSVLDDPDVARSDLLKMLNSPEGRRVIRRLFQSCSVFSSLPVTDPLEHARLEGRQSVGNDLFWQVVACSPNFVTMLLQEDMNNV